MGSFVRKTGVYAWHAFVSVAALALILVVVWAVSYSATVHRRRQAEQLLHGLAALQLGAPGSPAVEQIARDFGGERHCASDLCTYDFEKGFAYTDSASRRVMRRTEWDYLGLRPWQVNAHIEMRRGVLTDMGFRVLVGRGRGWLYNEGLFSGSLWAWLMVGVEINTKQFEQIVGFEKDRDRGQAIDTGHQIAAGANGIIVRQPHLTTPGSGEILAENLSLDAPAESRHAAFDINLRCATAMSPCTELCQLSPSAWHSYSQYQKSNGWWVDEPSDCTQATRR